MKRKIGLLSMALVVCLCLLGTGYAHWTKDLVATGLVTTGSVDAAWIEVESWDSEPSEKNESGIECTVDDVDPTLLHVHVVNGYPCIDYFNHARIVCTGSVPIHVTDITIINDNPCLEVGLLDLDLNYLVLDPPPQLHTDDTLDVVIWVHLLNEAPEQSSLSFDVVINSQQYNECCGECCNNQPPDVTVTRPSGGEVWYVGQTQAIQWTATDPDHDDGDLVIDIYYSADDGATFFPLPFGGGEALGLPNTGSFAWTIPNDSRLISAEARIKVVATDPCEDTGVDVTGRFCPPPPDLLMAAPVDSPFAIGAGS